MATYGGIKQAICKFDAFDDFDYVEPYFVFQDPVICLRLNGAPFYATYGGAKILDVTIPIPVIYSLQDPYEPTFGNSLIKEVEIKESKTIIHTFPVYKSYEEGRVDWDVEVVRVLERSFWKKLWDFVRSEL